jgi:hypothetical protein
VLFLFRKWRLNPWPLHQNDTHSHPSVLFWEQENHVSFKSEATAYLRADSVK